MLAFTLKSITYTCICMLLFSCNRSQERIKTFSPDNPAIKYCGRINFNNTTKPELSSAGSFFTFRFKGKSCILMLENQYEEPNHNYISITIDGVYKGRMLVSKGINSYTIAESLKNGKHTIMICKLTDPFIGYIKLQGIQCKKILPGVLPARKIEFIGNSITSGAECDLSEFLCDSGVWHDRHNAYMAYGPITARKLSAQWVLSSISGIGLTRNWNNEGPGIPSFYDNLFLNSDSAYRWTPGQYMPDLVTVCLGTNDNSAGDGSYDRKPLDSATFINAYVDFIKHLRTRYPSATICLLNSPVFDDEDKDRFSAYLQSVITVAKDSKLYTFSYSRKYGNGCSGHPNIEEHQQMSDELLNFIKPIMRWD